MDTGTTVTRLLDDSDGSRGLHQRKLSLGHGAVAAGTAAGFGESWYVMSGTVRLASGATLGRDTGAWLPPGTTYRLLAEEAAEILVTSLHADTAAADGAAADGAAADGAAADGDPAMRVVSLADCPVERTGDRKFRVLLSSGLTFTQFVGEIPPGRAPAHHHTYDEVVHVLSGHGVVHRDGTEVPIGAGISIYLSPYTQHCLENTGTDTLRVLGVFHPAGSPAMKYTRKYTRKDTS